MSSIEEGSTEGWRARFPDATRVLRGEGEATYLARSEGAWWVIRDSGTAVALLDDDDRPPQVHIERFDSETAAFLSIGRQTSQRTSAVADLTLRKAAPRIARELEQLARERGRSAINERDHLGPVATDVIGRTNPTVAEPLGTRSQAPHGLDLDWPRLGKIDLALGDRPYLPAFVEMKCGHGRNALAACAWDALKLAFCLDAEVTSAGFLLAAATTDDWLLGIRGAEFFTDADFSTADLHGDFADWWRFWEKDGASERFPAGYHPPRSVPGAFRTLGLCPPETFVVGSMTWELRISKVELLRSEPFAWQRFRS